MKYLTCLCFALTVASNPAVGAEFNMKPSWDQDVALANPHKGWYHHFPDNGLYNYRVAQDKDLLEIPGMDHVYIRLAWSYLEPKEGVFNWALIDDMIARWRKHGLGIAFRISCQESGTDPVEQQYATPRWVVEAGARGGHYRYGEAAGPDAPWEPLFDDPVFLEKLEHFLAAFAARYDGQPWVRYVDIGSIGSWGEGHTYSGSQQPYGFAVRKRHVDLHLEYFKKSQLVVTDDFVYEIKDVDDRKKLHRYIVDKGIAYRDDSILVDWYVQVNADTDTVRSKEYFTDTYRERPSVLELEHYGSVTRNGNWRGKEGSSLAKFGGGKSGPDMMRGAVALLHATYIGYHGDARDWISDNPALTTELLNRCGYWYFPHTVETASALTAGEKNVLTVTWENRGVAPAYNDYDLQVRLEGADTFTVTVPSSNRTWMPSLEAEEKAAKVQRYEQVYNIDVPTQLEPGTYTLKLRLITRDMQHVFLALDRALLDADNFYTIGTVTVSHK
jgi:hypothetical protein